MHLLTRTVRFTLGGGPGRSIGQPERGSNGHGGKPAMDRLGTFCELRVSCLGEPDAVSGYLINIKEIDAAIRADVVPWMERAFAESPETPLAGLLRSASEIASASLPVLVNRVSLHPTPYLSLEAEMSDGASGAVVIRQQLEFSASHRLHVPALSDEENRRLFGKCNNPAGHGHNYRVEPAVEVDPSHPMPVGEIERITGDVVIERFDHKHLNEQTAEFADDGGVNPSVEHIARVCFELLQGPIGEAGGTLRAVTVWETDRTCCTYPA